MILVGIISGVVGFIAGFAVCYWLFNQTPPSMWPF